MIGIQAKQLSSLYSQVEVSRFGQASYSWGNSRINKVLRE
jgi:hypothetical protein